MEDVKIFGMARQSTSLPVVGYFGRYRRFLAFKGANGWIASQFPLRRRLYGRSSVMRNGAVGASPE